MSSLIYIIAGEASGDFLGGGLMQSLRDKYGEDVQFAGIGGEHMQAHGLRSLFPMIELSLMGFVEILPHIFRLKRRIRETVADIQAKAPALIITIDSPGFCFRVVKSLRQKGSTLPAIHYVAPSVWAYKPERAAKTAALYQHLLTLLPFEPPYFEKEGLAATHVGHPVAWEWRTRGDSAAFRAQHGIAPEATVLGMMPGSRAGEVKRHLPIFAKAMAQLKDIFHVPVVVMPVRAAMEPMVRSLTQHWPVRVVVVQGDAEKKNAFAAMDVAIAKSGTVGLEVALAGIPSICAYRANPISMWLIRRMALMNQAHLVNIISGFEAIPELIQERCTPELLSYELQKLLENPSAIQAQKDAAASVMQALGGMDIVSPSQKAAEVVSKIILSSLSESR